MSFIIPDLPYAYDALQPYIDVETMHIHHDKHHQAYVDNLNKAIADSPLANESLEAILAQIGKCSPAVRNNAGGHWNHSFFWEIMTPSGKDKPTGALAQAIEHSFGSFEQFKTDFNAAGLGRFGSGWAWLIVKKEGNLAIVSTPNQDNPLMDIAEIKGFPILGVDVWEHAYYLKYQNKRADYLNAFWSVVNWDKVEQLYAVAIN